MTPEEIAAMRQRHRNRQDAEAGSCVRCHPWEPDTVCDTIHALDALDRANERGLEAMRAMREQFARAEAAEADVNEWKSWEAKARGRAEAAEAHIAATDGRYYEVCEENDVLKARLAAVIALRSEHTRPSKTLTWGEVRAAATGSWLGREA